LEDFGIVVSCPVAVAGVMPFDPLLTGDKDLDLEATHAAVMPDTVAKILLTAKGNPSFRKNLARRVDLFVLLYGDEDPGVNWA